MDHPVPFIFVALLFARLKADVVAPGMTHLTNLRDQIFQFGMLFHFVETVLIEVAFYKLHVEVIKVS